MRLINANTLKKYKFKTEIADGVELEVVPVSVIDDAPTIVGDCKNCAFAKFADDVAKKLEEL